MIRQRRIIIVHVFDKLMPAALQNKNEKPAFHIP